MGPDSGVFAQDLPRRFEPFGLLRLLSSPGRRQLDPPRQPAPDEPALLDEMHGLLTSARNPPGFRLATGELAKGATGRSALTAYMLLLGRLAMGARYTRRDPRLSDLNYRLAFNIMHSNFGGWTEKGLYCCATCTLSMLPLYCTHAFEVFDCDLLRDNVVRAVRGGGRRTHARRTQPKV